MLSLPRRTLLGAALAACAPARGAQAPAFPMRRGINLGNALEAPREGDWGYRIELAHLDAIAHAGFDGVRLPVRWDAHTQSAAPYAIAPDFMARVGEIVEACLARDLMVQLDVHHYDALNAAPDAEEARFLAIWDAIAARFAGASPKLMFEVLNEPNGAALNARRLSASQASALARIRPAHPDRLVVLSGTNWGSIDGLDGWTPPQDPAIAVTVHYYEPHAFTHERAEWLGADAPRFGRAWGARRDFAQIHRDAARAATWALARDLPLQLGEFGVNRALPLAQRALWTRAVREAFEAEGAGWCVWDFAGAFPVWENGRFDGELIAALFQ